MDILEDNGSNVLFTPKSNWFWSQSKQHFYFKINAPGPEQKQGSIEFQSKANFNHKKSKVLVI